MNLFLGKISGIWKWFAKLSLLQKGFFLLILLFLIWVGWTHTLGAKNNTPQYQTAQVTRGTLIVSVSASGQVTVANKTAVTSQASGVISQVYVQNGDTVTAGDKIADITLDATGQQRQAAAWASYLSAQNSLAAEQAKLNSLQSAMFVANQKFVTDRGVTNPTDQQKADPVYIEEQANWLQAQADYINQQNVIAQAQAALSSSYLSYQAASSTIVAPTSGTITDLTITPGIPVVTAASASNNTITPQQVAAISNGGTPIIGVSIAESDVPSVKVGQKATITFDALPNKTYTGKILGIDTTGVVSSGVTSYPATIVLDSGGDEILPNMNATANIITQVKDNVLLVPNAAVQTAGGQSVVRVLQNNQITNVPVTAGESSDTQTEITSGLSEGQTVVTGVTPTGNTGSGSSGTSPFSGTRGLGGFGGGGGGGAVFRTGGGGGGRGG